MRNPNRPQPRIVALLRGLSPVLTVLCLSLISESMAGPAASPRRGEICGSIVDAADGIPLIGATVSMVGRFGGAIADTVGQFCLTNLPSGTYTLKFSHVGYEDLLIDSLDPSMGELRPLLAALHEKLTTIKGITVTPGQFEIMGTEPTARQSLTRGELETVPQVGEDFFRAVARLPGMSGNDYSTRFVVRGGEYDEVLVTLDGLQIYEPFHLRDIDGGAISVVDVAAVEGIDLMTGGFTAEFGDKMSGVFSIKSRQASLEGSRLTVGLSMLNARLLSEGTFANRKGSWLISARRGYVDMVLKLVDPEYKFKPTYYDLLGKTQYQLNDRHILGVSVLHAADDLFYHGEGDEAGDSIKTSYGNSYAWLTLWSELHPKITARTIGSIGQVMHRRAGQTYDLYYQGVETAASDRENFRVAGVKSDFECDASDHIFLRWGIDAKWMEAEYDYFSEWYDYSYHQLGDSLYVTMDGIDTSNVFTQPSGRKLGLYLTARYRPWRSITAELGIRYDHTSYTADKLVSPRAGLVFQLSPRTTLRTGWGIYYQSEGIDEIMAKDGETRFFPAEKAEHRVAGFQHDFENGVHFRVEGYYKRYSDLRPDHRNSHYDIQMFPELDYDRTIVYRTGGASRGVELYLKKDMQGTFSWWASYALAKFEDDVSTIAFPPESTSVAYNRTLPTPNDQRHTLYCDVSIRPDMNWQINLAFQLHTGWPFTDAHMATVPFEGGGTLYYVQSDEQLSSRFDAYRRLDLRLNRYFRVGRGRITAYIEAINILDFENVRCYSYYIRRGEDRRYRLETEPEHWFGRLPSFGVAYEVGL